MTQNPASETGAAGPGDANGTARPAAASDNALAPLPPRAEVCAGLRAKVLAFLEETPDDEILRGLQGQVRVAMGVIEESLGRYGAEHLSLSYNGGKDCLVLLILILACLPASTSDKTLKAIYIVSRHPFPEVEDFVASSTAQYHLDLARYALSMRPALEAYLQEQPDVKAVFVGTRRTDPHGEFLTHFDPTDKDWPQFMRIHPVIDWHYVEIWAFIRHLNIPFCDLYNRGFTSLGGTTDTHPNPALAVDGSVKAFRPAYELMDDDEERLGRDH